MNQVNARYLDCREWRSCAERNGRASAAFAMQIKDKYKFSSGSTDPYQAVKDWLLHYLSISLQPARNR